MKKNKILVIDDSETNLYLIKSVFTSRDDIMVYTEVESRRALSTIKEIKPDIILLDLMMPGTDGFQLLKRLKANAAYHTIPVLIISAVHKEEVIRKSIEAGASGYIKKPISINELIEKINSLITVPL